MSTMKDAMKEAGFKLSPESKEKSESNFQISKEDSLKIKKSLKSLKRKLRRATCRECSEDLKFIKIEGQMIPHNLDGIVHWRTCPYSSYTQRKASLKIMKKLAVLFIVKLGLDLEKEAGLTPTEVQVVHSVLEKAFKSTNIEVSEKPGKIVDNNTEDTIKEDLKVVDDDSKETAEKVVHGDDPIGDPDEELAPSEDAITAEVTDLPSETTK